MIRVMAVLLVTLLPFAAGQTQVAMDAEGDQTTSIEPAGEMAIPRWATLDLLSLTYEERPENFLFTLAVAELGAEQEGVAVLDDVIWRIYFTFEDTAYMTSIYHRGLVPDSVLSSGDYEAIFWKKAGDGNISWDAMQGLELTVDENAGLLSFAIPRGIILDSGGAAPRIGTSLHGFYADSTLALQTADPLPASLSGTDRMPDTGLASAVQAVVFGLAQDGHARLSSERPVRISNGEATTFLYEIDASNLADRPDTFSLTANGAPNGWVVTFPEERIRLGAGENATIPVLLTVPFNHEHGAYYPVMIELQSQSDPRSTGRMELGVRYTTIPQPAGHHSTQWLHAIDETASLLLPGGVGTFNAEENDPVDTGEPIPAQTICQNFHSWHFTLSPQIAMGLDVDLDAIGTLTTTIKSGGLLVDGILDGEIYLRYPVGEQAGSSSGDWKSVSVANVESAPVTLQPGEEHTFSVQVTPTGELDYWPFIDRATLEMRLYLQPEQFLVFIAPCLVPGAGLALLLAPPPEPTVIMPGGTLDLPLEEFHDDVDEYFFALSGIELVADGSQQRLVNPGETVLFTIDATSLAADKATYDLQVTGSNLEWATIVTKEQFVLGPDGVQTVTIAVSVPAGAGDGELADITLHAQQTDNPNIRSLIRMLAEVDTDDDHADQAEEMNALLGVLNQESPSPAVVWLFLALALVVVRSRRP